MNKRISLLFILFFLFYISALNVLGLSEIKEKQEELLETPTQSYQANDYNELVKYLQSSIVRGEEVSVSYTSKEELNPLNVWYSVYDTYIDTVEDYIKNLVDPNKLLTYLNKIVKINDEVVDENRYYFDLRNINYSRLTSNTEFEYINTKMDEIIDSLDLKYLTTYEKVEKIHDWICNNFSYDYSMKNLKIYDGFQNGSFICSSYSSLAYNLLNRAGIETRILYGDASGLHNWNLVKMDDGLWYYLDVTWDDTSGSKNYFLQGTSMSYTHRIHSIFLSSISKYYNIANSSYYYKPPIDPRINTDIKEFFYDEKEPVDIVIPWITFNDSTDLDVFLNDIKLSKDEYKLELDLTNNAYNCTIFKTALNKLPNGLNKIRINFNDARKLDFYFDIHTTKINYPELNISKNIYLSSPYYLYFENLSKDAKVKYTSSDKEVLKVITTGKVAPIKEGKATISCEIEQEGYLYKVNIDFNVIKGKSLDKKYEKTIKVESPKYNPIITVQREMNKGEKFEFVINGLDENPQVIYNLSDEKVVSLNGNKILAKKKGSSMLTININQNNTIYTYKILVKVN